MKLPRRIGVSWKPYLNRNEPKHNKSMCEHNMEYCVSAHSWWRHQMETFFPRYWPFVRGIHRSRWIPPQRPVTRSFDVFFDLRPNKRLSKQRLVIWYAIPPIMTSLLLHWNWRSPKPLGTVESCRCGWLTAYNVLGLFKAVSNVISIDSTFLS